MTRPPWGGTRICATRGYRCADVADGYGFDPCGRGYAKPEGLVVRHGFPRTTDANGIRLGTVLGGQPAEHACVFEYVLLLYTLYEVVRAGSLGASKRNTQNRAF